jgi:uncharacterized protein (TIGR03083 family)
VDAATPDYAGAYREVRARVVALVEHATDAELAAVAPATPEWRARDVLAHLVGVTSDILTGTIDGITTDAWTDAQVAPRRDRPVAELVAEWEDNSRQVEPMIPSFGVTAGQFVFDAVTHEHDIRGALGRPGARDSSAIAIAFAWSGDVIRDMRDGAGVGALRIEADGDTLVCGNAEATASCRTSRFEVVRAVTGRRSADQIRDWAWDGDGEPRLDLFVMPIFTPRAEALVE